jgi:hypothetical protein
MKKHCRKSLVDQKTNQGGPQQKARVVEHIEEKDSTFFAFMAKKQVNRHMSSSWYIDLGTL